MPDGAYAFFDRSKTPKRSNRYLFNCEAIIIAGEGAEFRPKKYIGKFDLHQRAYAIYGFGEKLLCDYLFYYLEHAHPYFQRVAVGATVKSLRQRHFDELPIILPPIEEQQRIVDVLDEAFASIAAVTANAECILSNARTLFYQTSSRFLTEGGKDWQQHSLDQVCSISSKLVDPRLQEFVDLPHVGAGNMESRTGKLSNVLTAREENLISGKFLFEPTMVLYSKIRPYLMKACRPDFAGLCSADVYPLAPRVSILDRDFLFHILLSREFTAYAEAGSARAGMPKVNRDHLFAYRLNLPPIEKQREIAARIDMLASACGELVEGLENKLDLLEALTQSLLHRAFSGELAGRKSVVSARSKDNFGTPQFAAQVVAFAFERHVAKNRAPNFGTVKAEKILHMVEALGGIDLGRHPTRRAAGPDDAEHRHATWDWARSNQFFQFVKRGNGHDFTKLASYSAMIVQARSAVTRAGPSAVAAIELLVDMDTDFAELVATTHAAWNNLVVDDSSITDDAIVRAARDDWHPAKLKHDKSRFHDAIRFIRKNGIVPDGSAKRVGGQENLLL